jgi:flagella basal body P-ring formation protein FlgA
VTHRRVKRQPVATVGETVQIVAEFGPLIVSAEGRMLADAFLGDHVRVANLATDAVVQGVLIAPGRVKAGGSK